MWKNMRYREIGKSQCRKFKRLVFWFKLTFFLGQSIVSCGILSPSLLIVNFVFFLAYCLVYVEKIIRGG